jgi:inorganic phosphate transporter, PiT family
MDNTQLLLLLFTIAIALAFDLVNGFHDAANSIATVVSTRVLRPHTAVLWAAFCNFIAMVIFAPRVAETISQIVHIQPNDPIYMKVVLAGILGAIIWDLATWWLGLPTSSSHALIGGFAGAGVMHAGFGALSWPKLLITIQFIIIAPLLGIFLGFCLMVLVCWLFKDWRPGQVDRLFRKGQLVSSTLYSLGHGGNDAQKTMGIILALLVAAGHLAPGTELSLTNPQTLWIIAACHIAMAIGTAMGGWRIVRTMGMKITKLKPVSGFCAETAGAFTIFLSTFMGIPVSTTHTITGAIVGAGTVTNRLSGVRWGVAARIVWSWIFTIPFAAFLGAFLFWLIR